MFKFSVPDFKGPFELALKYEYLYQIESYISQVDARKNLEKVKKIYLMANKDYNSLNIAVKWNITSGNCHAYIVGGFCNCDSADHLLSKFPHPHNEDKIKQAKEEYSDNNYNGKCGESGKPNTSKSGHGKWSK